MLKCLGDIESNLVGIFYADVLFVLQMNITIEFIISTSHLLVGVNSAANFFIYLLLRKNFRAATWRLLTCARPPEDANCALTRGGRAATMTRTITASSATRHVKYCQRIAT